MKSIVLVSKIGQRYRVTVPDPKPDMESAYIFAFVKSGSTLLNNMVETYCQYINAPSFSLFNTAFDQGISTQNIQDDALICFKKSGYIYTGFRHFPAFNLDVKSARAIWLTRDPRDMLVSRYYSILKSHKIPKGLVSQMMTRSRKAAEKLDINQYAIKTANSFARDFQLYREKLADCDLKVYRYEDVIYKKEEWLADVVAKLGLQLNTELVSDITQQFDVFPDAENENEHIRQVHPGNHTEKLTPQTIKKLNKLLSNFLAYFDYEH